MRFLLSSFLLILISSACSRQSAIIPISNNTEYIHDRLTAVEANDVLQVKINFDRETRKHFVYYVSIDNISNQPVDILTSDFYYTTNDNATKFRAIEHPTLIEEIDRNIAYGQATNEAISYLQILHNVEDLVANISNSDKELSKEAKLENKLEREQEYSNYALNKSIQSNDIIQNYQLKEKLDQFYLMPTQIAPGQSYSGIIYFPRAKNRVKEGLNITYSSNKGKFVIPFGTAK